MNYRQLRNRVLRLRRRNRTASTDPAFEVFSTDTDIYQRVPSARQAAFLADELATRNPGTRLHVFAPDYQHVYEVEADMPRQAAFGDLEFRVHTENDLGLDTWSGAKYIEAQDQAEADDYVDVLRGDWIHAEVDRLHKESPQEDLDALLDYVVGLAGEWTAVPVDSPHKTKDKVEADMPRHTAGFDTDESLVTELVDWINNSQVPYNQLQAVEKNMTRKMGADRYDRDRAIKGFMYAVESGAKDYARGFGGSWREMFPEDIRLLAAEELRDMFEAEVDINPQDYEEHVYKKHLPKWQERYPKEGSTTMKRQAAPNRRPISNRPGTKLEPRWLILIEGDDPQDLPSVEAMEGYWEHPYLEFEAEVVDMLDPTTMEISGIVVPEIGGHPGKTGDTKEDLHTVTMDMLGEVGYDTENLFISVRPLGNPTSEKLNRGASAATTRPRRGQYQEGEIMTRRPSKNRRRRFASRVERAQRRDVDKTRQVDYDDQAARLERRVASLSRLLRKAELDLAAEERPSSRRVERPSSRREARVADIRERIATERRRKERVARIQRRVRAKRRIAELQREADTARRPPSRKPAPRRASRKLAPAAKGKRYIATYHKGDKAAGKPPYKILDQETGKTHVLVDEK